ncbi:MAG: hypothetical protein IE917_01815 [Betaproteobacteria bacterium]|nr:hypothetical protein [Betaproteobacteria bacterium]
MKFFWVLTFLFLASCVNNPRVIDHAFSFDARNESPGIEVLNYRYGESIAPGAQVQDYSLRMGKIPQAVNINGAFPLEDSLYVKWRDKVTGNIYEDTVDLRSRLPRNIAGQRIHFIISGGRLFIYLIGSGRLSPNPCPSREELHKLAASDLPDVKVFSMYCYRKITRVYPDQ